MRLRREFPGLILIYSDSQICDLEWIPYLSWWDRYQICHDIQEYVAIAAKTKIAFTAHRLHVQHDCDMLFESKVWELSQHSQCVFALESELHSFHFNIWSQCHKDNVYWLLPGHVNDSDDIDNHIIYWGDWFKTTAGLYRALPEVLASIDTSIIKPKRFDALLGSPKPHRKFVYDSVIDSGLTSHVVMTYGGQWSDDKFYAQDYFIYEPGTEVIDPANHRGTMDWARYHGHQCHLSQIIPLDIFNSTSYSIIAETDYDNRLSFFSEKTAKPIISRRLFIVFSGYRFLHNLRRLGFRTFDGIIDESYDEMPHGLERWNQAFEQVKRLCQADPGKIRDDLEPIVEHNYHVMMDTDWTQYARDGIQGVIDRMTNSAQR